MLWSNVAFSRSLYTQTPKPINNNTKRQQLHQEKNEVHESGILPSKNEKREKNYVRKNSFLAMQNENILTQVIYLWHQV